jgi:tetratricopeptide (TPR) repeat protein
MYLASLPLAVLGAAGLLRLRDAKVEWAWPLGGSAACGLVVAWAALAMAQSVIWRDSIALWTRAIDLDPRHQIAYYNRGLAHFEAGRPKLAIADYTKAIELAPYWAWPYGNRGVARMETDPESALEDFTRVIELEPKAPMTYANRAVARETLGDVEGAIADRERALELAAPDWSKRAEVRKALETLRQRGPR